MTLLLSEPRFAPRRTDGTSRPTLVVDLEAVAANTRLFARRATGDLMAVVKADGFGLGAADVARTALSAWATRLGVTRLEGPFARLSASADTFHGDLAYRILKLFG